MGSLPASFAAAKAAIHMGGVMNDSMPKYSTYMCAAMGETPTSIMAGATKAATST